MKKGFTLIELLVVIGIIGILVTIATASYGTAQKKSRDSRRVSDMKDIQNAWEQYFADNNSNYPDHPQDATNCSLTTMDSSITYLPGGFPVDPKSNISYPTNSGWSKCSTTSFCFCAAVEYAADGNSGTDCIGGIPPTGYNGFYCVKNLQ